MEAVLDAVTTYGCRLVEVTGGEPLAQPAVLVLLQRLVDAGYEVLLETSGAVSIAAVPEGVKRIVDLKAPDSGESARNDWRNLEHLRAGDEVKFVLASRRDYEWARDVVHQHRLHDKVAVLFSPVHGCDIQRPLAEWLLEDRLPVRYQIQLHKYVWPGVERGV